MDGYLRKRTPCVDAFAALLVHHDEHAHDVPKGRFIGVKVGPEIANGDEWRMRKREEKERERLVQREDEEARRRTARDDVALEANSAVKREERRRGG